MQIGVPASKPWLTSPTAMTALCSAQWRLQDPQRSDLAPFFGEYTTWADEDYMEAYFEIDNRDSDRSGLRKFGADSGLKDVGLNLAASFKPWRHWGLMGLVSYKRLLNDAEDSPVVDDEGDENQFVGGILVIYNF